MTRSGRGGGMWSRMCMRRRRKCVDGLLLMMDGLTGANRKQRGSDNTKTTRHNQRTLLDSLFSLSERELTFIDTIRLLISEKERERGLGMR